VFVCFDCGVCFVDCLSVFCFVVFDGCCFGVTFAILAFVVCCFVVSCIGVVVLWDCLVVAFLFVM